MFTALLILLGLEGLLIVLAYALSAGDWRRTGLYLLVLTAPLEVYRTPLAGVDVSLFRLSLFFAVGILLVTSRGERRGLMRWVGHPLIVAYLLLFGVFVVGTVTHPGNLALGLRESGQIGAGVVTLIVVAEFARRESAERVASVIVVGSILPILGAAWLALTPKLGDSAGLPLLRFIPAAPGLEVTRQTLASFGPIGARMKGTFGDSNHFGLYIVFVLCLAFALTVVTGLHGNRRAQVCYAAMVVAATATLTATFSRTGWIAAAIGVVIISIWLARAWHAGTLPRPNRTISVLVIIGALALAVPVAHSVAERLAPGSKINAVSDQTHERTVTVALDQFRAHPVLGIGPGGLGAKLRLKVSNSSAHDTYLAVAAELGVAGLLALLWAAWVTVRLLVRACRVRRGVSDALLTIALAASYAGFLAGNLTYDIWWDDFHWVILGAIVGIAAGAIEATAGSEVDAQSGVDLRGLADERGPRTPVVSLELRGADAT